MFVDKYENLSNYWREKVYEIDFEVKYKELNLDGYNEYNLPIRYYGIDYIMDRKTFEIYKKSNPKEYISTQIKFAIYHLFYFSKPKPLNSNIFIPLYEIKKAAPFYNAFKNTVITKFEESFNGKLSDLKMIIEDLGFLTIPESDFGFIAPAFSCMPIKFLFWDGDEEFSSQGNILFDKNITDFIHEETIITIAADGVTLLSSFL